MLSDYMSISTLKCSWKTDVPVLSRHDRVCLRADRLATRVSS